MVTSLSTEQLINYTSRQLNYFYPDDKLVNLNDYKDCVFLALDRLEFCYSKVSLKHYFNVEQSIFNHLHSDHYIMYLWFLANTIWNKTQHKSICNKLYYLNKTLHGMDCMFDTKLPDIFLIFHGVGTMLGKATYSDYFVALQGCTVGNNKGKYPEMDKGVALTAHSSIIGDCKVGKLVTISSYTSIFDMNIEEKQVVFKNDEGKIICKPTLNSFAQSFFNVDII
jgi:serine O-acetyltransferase